MIEYEDLLNKSQIGELLGVVRERARQLTLIDSFPEPFLRRGKVLLWERQSVLKWAKKNNRVVDTKKVTKLYTPKKYIPHKQHDNVISPREYEVLCLLADGYSRSEIAKKLNIARGAIDAIVRSLAARWHISFDKYLIDKAIELNLISVKR